MIKLKSSLNKKTLSIIKESNEFGIDDRLSAMLNNNAELSEDELELVAAASAKPNYETFKKIIENKK